ncbi:HDOD domain-containing protein [Salinispira pacifica]|uniref:HD domain protein n=1 Tax=Salinispira pacifica TaxID=1307761 RepID=V5WJB3_9SPIO|nr:HDOD domain-containing protein [Salinispira pacifica]AHC15725.1 HD domain protein [Salinispira pacifica]
MSSYSAIMKSLPIMPDTAVRVINLANDESDIDFRDLEDIIKVDSGLTSKVLRVANSSLYAREGLIADLHTAISMLGFKNIRNLVVLVTASSVFHRNTVSTFFRKYWKHGIISAFAAREVARKVNRVDLAEEAFLAALLSNIGQAALFYHNREEYEEIYRRWISEGESLVELEELSFGTNHRLVGSEILKNWNFPDLYAHAAREHLRENITSPHKMLIIIVSTGNFLAENYLFRLTHPRSLGELKHYFPLMGLTPAGIQGLQQQVQNGMENDSLYAGVKDLFGLG